MKKYLLPNEGTLYKANLHCHSTFSDGRLTPEELKEEYKKRGYSIIAFTDHEAFFTHNDLTDDGFLALNGSELSVEEPADENGFYKVTHLCLIAKDKNMDKQVCFHPGYLWWYSDDVVEKFVSEKKYIGEYYNRVYSVDGINDMIKIAKENNFFVTYNHIGWSRESVSFVSKLENLDGFELCNYGSYIEGFETYNVGAYDDLLRLGKKIYPISADDNHNRHDFSDLQNDSFGGFNFIKSKVLSYESVISALEKGDTYASMGPEIKSLYYEDGKYYIETSPVREIFLRAKNRRAERVSSKEGLITSAVFSFGKDDEFVRFSAIDEKGFAADTRAYYLSEFIKGEKNA